ncbi:hypothetical protein QCA50_000798 [Cerrena zonata]|uniref:Peptidase S59 domain-containing protein n=1 Tax=Cerrena zonata TaxID=2478898 RepID=A0AAW0GZL3_9APHY
MFGNNGISSSWGQPQQNQQQQAPSAFGQPAAGTSAFGTGTSTFGSGGAFGQPAQPQANPMFGSPATTGTGGFGSAGFGSTPAANTGTSMFGQPKPAGGFGGFGGGTTSGTSAFGGGGGTSAFGAANTGTGTGLFGSSTANTSTGSAFGGGSGGLFGGAKTASAFGTTTTTTNTSDSVPPVTTGTSNPIWGAFDEKDPSANTILHYQSISCMPSYRGTSFEELRFQDYNQGRKTASTGGAFGQNTFGQPAQPTTGMFGQPIATTTQPSTSAFGGGGGAFGTNTNTGTTNAFGSFGQPANNQPSTTTNAFGGFGQQNQQQQPQPQSTGFGGFGQTQQPQPQPSTGGSLFGGGTFGQNQPKPFGGGFGTAGTTTGTNTNAFGGTATGAFGQPNQPQSTGTSLFGQPNQSQPAQTSGFGFGTNNNNNNQPKTSLFGNQSSTGTAGFGSFGTQPQPNQQGATGTGLFGGGGGLFGQNNQQPPQQQQQPTQGGGLFGNTQQTQPANGGLFGGGGGLFGNTQNQQQNQQQTGTTGAFGGSLFNKPATTAPSGGLFGGFGTNTNNAAGTGTQPGGGGLFGNLGTSTNNQTSTSTFGTGGGLFGSKPAGTTFGGTPSTQTGSTTLGGGSLFGGSFGTSTAAPAAPQQGSLTASIAQPIGTTMPVFSMLPPGPRATILDQQPKKKPAFFAELPTRSPQPRIQLNYQPSVSQLRGFGASTNNGSSLLTSGKPHALALSKANNKSLGPEAFLNGSVSSPGLGSGSRQSVKKLILDKKVEPSDLFLKSGISNTPKVTFNPSLSVAAREIEATTGSSSSAQRIASPAPAANDSTPRRSNRYTADVSESVLNSPTKSAAPLDKEPQPVELQEGDYYVKPDLAALKRKGYDELSSFEGLVVGRVGYGEIHFLEPVDLTGLQKLGALLGELVRFDDKECSVYPDSEDVDKPLPGSGLNVRARIILIRCWPLDKATREPIKDETHPSAVKHIRRLKHIKDTHFENFEIEEGKWTFIVEHF